MPSKVLKIGTLNCQSLCNKTEGVVEHFKERDIDVLMLQETFLKPKDAAKIKELQDHGVCFLSCPRTCGRERGGLAVIFKPTLKIKVNNKTDKYNSFEYMELTLETEEELIRFVNVYHPPYSKGHPYTELYFINEFEDFLEDLVTKPGVPVMVGDFNMRLNNLEERYPCMFKNYIQDVNLFQHVPMVPTHRRGGTLDLVITPEDIRNKISEVEILDHGTESDHFLVEFKLKFTPIHEARFRDLYYRKFEDIDIEKFKEDLLKANIHDEATFQNLDEVSERVQKILEDLMNKHCPLKKKRVEVNTTRSTWYDDELEKLKQRRRQLERRWCRIREPAEKLAARVDYNEAKKEHEKLVKTKRLLFHSKALMENKGDSKKLWGKINDLLGKPNTVLPDHSDPQTLAEDFKTFFTDKVDNIRDKIKKDRAHDGLVDREDDSLLIPTTTETTDDDESLLMTEDAELYDCLPSEDQEDVQSRCFVEFQCLSEEELYKTLKTMSKKFCSLDPIPVWLLLKCFEELKLSLMFIVNSSLTIGVFPSLYKKAVVKPTLKNHSGDKDLLQEYRPVSNLPFMSKVLERVALNQFNVWLEEEMLHCTAQSGYRPKHSCETLMVRMFNDILGEMELKKTVVLLLLDLSAAFDTIDHSILLKKLKEDYKIGGTVLCWFRSYLENRSFTVSVGDKNSSPGFLWFGVPQGSILGPILFILYTKELSNIARKHGLQIQLYADDSQLYIGFKPANSNIKKDTGLKIEACLKEIMGWMSTNFMKLNKEKTQMILLGTNNVLKKADSLQIRVGISDADVIDSSSCSDGVKSIGVVLDENLNMQKHIAKVRQSTFYTISNLGRIKNLLTRDLKIMLVKQLVLSKIDYHNALYVNLPDIDIKRLQGAVNAAVRFIYGAGKRVAARPLLIQAHILPVRYRITYKICLLTFKAIHGLAPEYLSSLIEFSVPSRGDNTIITSADQTPRKSNDHFLLKAPPYNYTKSMLSQRSFSYAAPQLWNSLPYSLRTCTSTEGFKKRLKTHLFTLFVEDPNEVV